MAAEAIRFPFRFDPRARRLLALGGVTPRNSWVEIGDGGLRVKFGFLRLRTPLSNVANAHPAGPYRFWRAIGARYSVSDGGVTFGTTTESGVCIEFHEPVKALYPFLRHPNATLTVDRPAEFLEALDRARAGG